ncbi:uncharacterized protein OCT59_028868 [Rhizophagus irregularis]|nr:hypothetical protein OCT59_028868 [Rhizophagus irregularis]
MHAIAFLIVNFIPIMIALCNIFKFHYIEVHLSQTNIKLIKKYNNINDNSDDNEVNNIIKELEENISKYYIPQHITVVITLGIYQFTFIIFCFILLKIRSWRWIKKSKLDNKKKAVHIIYQLEETLFLITTSFLGIWLLEVYILYYGRSGDAFGIIFGVISDLLGIITIIPICIVFIAIRKHSKILYGLIYFASLFKVVLIIGLSYKYYILFTSLYEGNPVLSISTNMFYRELIIIGIPTVLFLIILNVNTILCQKYIDEKVVAQRKEQNLNLKKLSINEWKFELESEISLLEIISIKNDNNNKNNEDVDDEIEKNTSKQEHSVEISFNAQSDIMIQTNYPLPNAFKKDTSYISLSPSSEDYYYYEITILSNKNIDETIIAIGFATKNHSTDRLPGCDTHSVGFHSDEGRTFHNEGYTGSKYAEKWGEVNDIIGCGYCPNTGQVFFTMNGKYLGIAYTGLFHTTWYPTIGSNGVCSLKVNFGQEEFKYKEANDISIAGMISSYKVND